MRRVNHRSTGYTLIELLLYVSILGSLLTAISLYFSTSTESRVKNQSIAEVNLQGALIMDRITQIIRNADSITTPAVNTCANSLTLVVPTGALSPTIFDTSVTGGATTLGYDIDGGTTDNVNRNFVNATSFVASVSGMVTSLNARIGPTVSASPNNRGQMAIYSGTSNPTTLLASSSESALTASAWNTFCIPPVKITAGQTYWIGFNTNAAIDAANNLRYHAGTTNQSRWIAQTYGTWPASYTGTTSNAEFSMYASVQTGTGTGSLRIKEGAGATTAISNSKVQVSGLTIQNLTRSGTPGVVRVSFVVSRVNASNRNAYNYQKTFTSSASLR
jgi:type II secretory pathway pseudopilin PulG